MADVGAAIRAKLAQFDEYDPMFDQRQISNAADGMRAALLALVAEHEAVHRRLGPPHEDHTHEGLPLCQGWPYRLHADRLCRHIRTVAEALGIETEES